MTTSTIQIIKSNQTRISEVDFNNIPFGRIFTDHMFVADYENGEWKNMKIMPTGKFEVHPANIAWHYGQAIFEGMKASKDIHGRPLLFRPEMHAKRINASAHRMCMPAFPEDLFVEALHELVYLDQAWIPPIEGSALYIRPFMIATEEAIGVKISNSFRLFIICCPAGPYYGFPIKLKAEDKYIRAADGGVGEAKAAGNYAASLYPTQLAVQEGYNQVMWLDAREFKYIQEVGTMNIFFVIDGTVVTPSTTGSILRGITRNSIITLLKDKGINVETRPITIDEVLESYKKGKLTEVFGSGTAAVIAYVKEIGYKSETIELNPDTFKIASMIKNTINGIRNGTIEDKFNWTVPATPQS